MNLTISMAHFNTFSQREGVSISSFFQIKDYSNTAEATKLIHR